MYRGSNNVVANPTITLKVLMWVTGNMGDCRMHRSHWFGPRTRVEISRFWIMYNWRKANMARPPFLS